MNRATDYTPLANRTTVSSRNKMATLNGVSGIGQQSRLQQIRDKTNNHHHNNNNHLTTNTNSRIPPKTVMKPPPPSVTAAERPTAQLAATSSRIALPRSRLSALNDSNSPTSTQIHTIAQPSKIASTRLTNGTNSRLASALPARSATSRANTVATPGVPSFANSRSSSKLSSVSSITTNNHHHSSRQSSLTNAQSTLRKQLTGGNSATNYIPDTNTTRKGLAKFSNPIECQRQFQALNSEIRHLTAISEQKGKQIVRLQEQLDETLEHGVGYATVVQYLAKKLKIDSDIDLEKECELLKQRVAILMVDQREYENKLESIVSDYKSHLDVELDLRAKLQYEFDEAKECHSAEIDRLNAAHIAELAELEETHQNIKGELESRVQNLESDLEARTKDLSDVRKENEILTNNFNKLEESLTRDKDARVKYAQEKANQLQKDVDSLNCVLEMKTERIHVLEKDSILLAEVQQELAKSHDQNKALKQQSESLTAALENKRIQYEKLMVDHEKIAQELKRERKERRRMTMRSEQLEFVLNESCATDNNVTVIDQSFGP